MTDKGERELIRQVFQESAELGRGFIAAHLDRVLQAAELITESFRQGHKLLVFGNGGSAADAQHFAAEFVNRFRADRPALPAIALTTDTSVLTSISNDYDYALVFARQIAALGQAGDVALGITTSGNSPNVLRAFEEARRRGLRTIALTGADGGKAAPLAELALIVPSPSTPRVQEVHLVIEHLLCELIEDRLAQERQWTGIGR